MSPEDEEVARLLEEIRSKAVAPEAIKYEAKAAESEGRIAEIRDSALQSVREVADETAQAVVAAILPDAADKTAVQAAVKSAMEG